MATPDGAADALLRRPRRQLASLVTGLCLVAAAVFAATRPSGNAQGQRTGTPTDAEARAVLDQTFAAARNAPDALAFCADSQARAICINQYNGRGGRSAVPPTPPTVIGSLLRGPSRVLTVCGVDGRGVTYRADFPVERNASGELDAVLEVFWDSKTYSGTVPDGQPIPVTPGPQQFSC